MELGLSTSVEIRIGDKLVAVLGNRPTVLMSLRGLLLIAKFESSRKEITLDNEFIVDLVKQIDAFLENDFSKGTDTEKAIVAGLSGNVEIDQELLESIIQHYSIMAKDENEFENIEEVITTLKLAIFPYKIDCVLLEKVANTIFKSRK